MQYQRWCEQIQGKTVGFLGAGVSNTPLVYQYLERGFSVTVRDKRTREQMGDLAVQLETKGAVLILGAEYLQNITEDVLFRSPGMQYFLPELTAARRRGAVVTSEIELFFELCPCKLYAVTGSDGKTTTTTVISEILRAAGHKVWLGGNIGTPLLPLVEQMTPDDIAVVELSSFQLISMTRSPDVAVVTNVAPNHLDIHKDMQEYIDAKRNIYLHQPVLSRTVLNADNEITRNFAPEVRGHAVFFSRRQQTDAAWCDEQGRIFLRDTFLMNADEIRIPGWHNVENYLAAFSALMDTVPTSAMISVAKTFGGVEHRCELVRERNGVKWYNDSIASSPTRTIAGLNAMTQKVILIAGGYDKHIPYAPLGPKVVEKVKMLILTGATADAIEQSVRAAEGFAPDAPRIIRADSVQQAVQIADELAQAGDIVTLSPASASFDSYRNFEERGNHYKQLVLEL